MAIKNNLYGGTDWESPSRIKPVDLNDTFDKVYNTVTDNVCNLTGKVFKNQAQLLYNSAYIGFNSKLNVASGVPNLKNVRYDVFNSDTSSDRYNFIYNSTDKLFQTTEYHDGTGYFIDLYTDTSSKPTIDINNCAIVYLGMNQSGKYIYRIYCTSGTTEVRKAQVLKTLFSVERNITPKINLFSGITEMRTSDSNDNGKRIIVAHLSENSSPYGTGTTAEYTGTFSDTTTNNNCLVWFNCLGTGLSGEETTSTSTNKGYFPASTIRTTDGKSTGTDTTSWAQNNPTNVKIDTYTQYGSRVAVNQKIPFVMILCNGTMTWSETDPSNKFLGANTDYGSTITTFSYQTDDLVSPRIIFQTTSLPTITDCIATWNSSIDSDNTLTVSISADGTNYEEVTDATIHRFTNTGTNLYIKFEIDRVDTSAVDKISEYAILYNITGA